ncbi:hypothetical protein AB0J72_21430 [Dactylosporangium sp. NPDC049742]|uniref:hypothetical protein n=1 Tax=Dactylosporangium sp. NPDC049742 TaxID=3154737 RepID=UPI0034471790
MSATTVYLHAGDRPGIYPMEQDPGFEAEQVAAMADGAVPLLWLALFRAGDVSLGDTPWGAAGAPLVGRERGLANLVAAVPALDRMFGPPVTTHADLLRQALQWSPGAWLTIEWWCDNRPSPPDPAALRSALGAFEEDGDGDGALLELCGLDPADLPAPRDPGAPLLPHLTAQAAGLRLLLGRAFHQLVPWEQPI